MKKVFLSVLGLGLGITLFSCSENNTNNNEVDNYTIKVVAPQGAPAVAVAGYALNNADNVSFIDAKNITEQFSANDNDIIIAPLNDGANQYKLGNSKYKVSAIVTWGNLYFATRRTDINTIEDLNGKDVTLFGELTINSSIAKYVLANKNITPNYSYLGSAADTVGSLMQNDNVIVLSAEPAITAQSMKNQIAVKSFSVQDLYSEVSGDSKFSQAALFVKEDTIKNHKAKLDEAIDKIKESCDLVTSDLDSAANNVITLGIPGLPQGLPILKKALPKCNINFVYANSAKEAINKTANIDLAKFGGELPSDDFYYNK